MGGNDGITSRKWLDLRSWGFGAVLVAVELFLVAG